MDSVRRTPDLHEPEPDLLRSHAAAAGGAQGRRREAQLATAVVAYGWA